MNLKEQLKYVFDVMRFSAESSWLVSHCRDFTMNPRVRYLIKLIVAPFCVFKCFPVKDVPGRSGLALVLIAKNEAPYIEEWINFHRKQGVSHFFIYDNESTDNLHEVLKPYIESGLVTYHFIKGRGRQLDAYAKAAHAYGRKYKYLAFIDADEFLFVRKNPYGEGHNLYDFVDGFMKAHPNAGALFVNWLIFGSSGHITKPEGGVLENFTKCAADDFDSYGKYICDPMKVLKFMNHNCICRRGFYTLDETGEVITEVFSEIKHFDHIRLNHYVTKSREEYIEKMNRGMADRVNPKEKRTMEYFDSHDRNEFTDTEILSYI